MIRLINILSLDVAIGSVAMAYLWAYYFQTPIKTLTYLALFLTVWLIYTADHLLDVYNKKSLTGFRYVFHEKYFKQLAIVAFLVLSTLAIFLYYVSNMMILLAGCVFLIVILHFVYSHTKLNNSKNKYPKEWVVALVYTIGVLLPSLTSFMLTFDTISIIIFLVIILIALTNLLLLSYFEGDEDNLYQNNSIVVRKGYLFTKKVIKLSLITIFLLLSIIFMMPNSDQANNIIYILSFISFFYLIIYWKKEYFQQSEFYRFFIDSILILPLLLFLIEK